MAEAEPAAYKEAPLGTEDPEKPIPTKVHVTAPSTLPEGYVFEAEIGAPLNKKTINVEVPPGGVVEGQVFLAPVPLDFGSDEPQLTIPTGQWKDGLFDFFKAGIFHPSLWCSLCCTQVAMGQIMHRLRLSWLGEVAPDASSSKTFKVVLTLVICYAVFSVALDVAESQYGQYTVPTYIPALKFIGSILFTIWSVYALLKTRENVREKYSIPEERCHGCEDLCCSLWCSCCVTAQIARHTGDYENHKGSACSETGMVASAPAII